MTRPQGPNVKKLIIRFIAKEAVPDGGGFVDALRVLADKERIVNAAKNATVLAFEAIDLVRAAPDCEWTTDEEIAQQIVEGIHGATK